MKPSRMPTIIVDFDGVLYSYTSGWQGVSTLPDPPVEGALKWLDEASDHFRVAILSTRSHQGGGIEAMRSWLFQHGRDRIGRKLQDGRVFFPVFKVPAVLSIDDRAWRFDGPGSFPAVEQIKAFEPWFKRCR